MATSKTISKKISEKTLKLRNQLWPNLREESLWHRKRKVGFTTIPRGMSYILRIMDDMSSGKPISSAYFVLWCHTFDEYIVTIANPRQIAFEAGFAGERAESTWRVRMKTLVDLGFVEAQEGSSGPYHYVLILNPYTVIKRHFETDNSLIRRDRYHALFERAQNIGAKDLL